MYRIHWKALLTGVTGCGTASFPKEQAKKICDDLNKKNVGILHHWIELAGDDSCQ